MRIMYILVIFFILLDNVVLLYNVFSTYTGENTPLDKATSTWVLIEKHDMENTTSDTPDYKGSSASFSFTTNYYHSPSTSISLSSGKIGWIYCTGDCPSHVKGEAWVMKNAPAGTPYVLVGLASGDQSSITRYYAVKWDLQYNAVLLVYYDGSSEYELNSTSLSVSYGKWYMVKIELDIDNGIVYGKIYDESSTLLVTVSSTKMYQITPSILIVDGGTEQYIDDVAIYRYSIQSITQYYTPITITENSGNNLTDYQVKIILNSTNWDGWEHVSSNGSDIYFLDMNSNPLYYWIEYFNATEQKAIIWVKVNLTALSNTTIYMYYGGENPYNQYNNPSYVFLFYDGFNNLNRWEIIKQDPDSSIYVENGVVKFVRPVGGNPIVIQTKESFSVDYPIIIEARQYIANSDHYYYHSIAIGDPNSNVWSSTGYVVYPGYESALYTGNGAIPPRTTSGSSTLGDIIDNPPTQTWFTSKFYVDPNSYLRHKYDNGNWQSSSRYKGVNNETVYIRYVSNSALSYSAESWIDWIRVRGYVDPEPSVSIGSSQPVSSDYPWFTASVNPHSVSVEPSDTISFNVNVTNTGNASGWVIVELVDHNNVSRDSENITLDVNQSSIITLSTVAQDSERGDWTWHIIGYNSTTTFFNISVDVSIHYNLTYSFSYNLQFDAGINATHIVAYRYNYTVHPSSTIYPSSISGIRYSYMLNVSQSLSSSMVLANRQGYLLGSSACLYMYINSTGNWTRVVEVCNSTVYTITFNFHYTVESGEGYPDARINIYMNDTGSPVLYTSVYIPQGNTSVMLPANHVYSIEIPTSGSTTYGYRFELVKYMVDGVENQSNVILDRNHVFDVYYKIYDPSSSGEDNGGGGGGSSTWITVTPPPIDANNTLLPPQFNIGSPNITTYYGILVLALFLGLFIIYSRVYTWGQALTVSSAVSILVSMLIFPGTTLPAFFMLLMIVGLGLWKILGK